MTHCFNSRSLSRCRPGTAEIELLLVIPIILLPILFLVGGMFILGPARMLNVFTAQQQAVQDADAEYPTLATPSDIQLDSGVDTLQSTINRVHEADAAKDVAIHLGNIFVPTVTLTDRAQVSGPAWAFSNWPVSADGDVIAAWSTDYANESTAQYEDPLELASAWPPQ